MSGRSEFKPNLRLQLTPSISKFGLAFQQAAEESGAGAKHDMFDTSVVEVRQADLTSFIEALHLRSA
jgi:cell division control protein 45